MGQLDKYSLAAVGERLEAEDAAERFRIALGQDFEPYDSPENYEKIAHFMTATNMPISSASLLTAFAVLTARGVLKREGEEEPPAAAPEPEPQKQERTQGEKFAAFYAKASAAEIRAKAATNKTFNAWLGKQIRQETQHQELPRDPERAAVAVTLPPSPPEKLRQFAETYHRTPASEVRKRLADEAFVKQMDECDRVGLI